MHKHQSRRLLATDCAIDPMLMLSRPSAESTEQVPETRLDPFAEDRKRKLLLSLMRSLAM